MNIYFIISMEGWRFLIIMRKDTLWLIIDYVGHDDLLVGLIGLAVKCCCCH